MRIVALVLFLFVLFLPPVVTADTIVTSGIVSITRHPDFGLRAVIDLQGEGFSLGATTPVNPAQVPALFPPNDFVSLTSNLFAFDFAGGISYKGLGFGVLRNITPPPAGSNLVQLSGGITLNAPTFALPPSLPGVEIIFQSPFSLSASFRGIQAGTDPIVFSTDPIFGTGAAFLTLVGLPQGGYQFRSLVYAIGVPSNIPEPATLLLLGTGLIGVVAGVRSQRKR